MYTKTQEHSFVVWSTGERVNDCEHEKKREKKKATIERKNKNKFVCIRK